MHGSYHWDMERLLPTVTLPLIGYAAFAGPTAWVDLALGVTLPLHCHLGLDCIILDYLPYRRIGIFKKVLDWTLRGATVLVIYGCYQFNTNDVGITGFVKRLWTGKL